MDDGPGRAVGLMVQVVFLLGVGLGFILGWGMMRDKAIEAGAAHWEADPTTGNVYFVWDPKDKEDQSDGQGK